MIEIRHAKASDVEAINEIYNYEVLHGVATFDTNVRSYDAAINWFNSHGSVNHPVYVAEDKEDSEGRVIAFCSLSTYYDKDAYENTVEISLYVHQDFRSLGIGAKMLEHILNYVVTKTSIHNVIAVITATNEASIKLFKVSLFLLLFYDKGVIFFSWSCFRKFAICVT